MPHVKETIKNRVWVFGGTINGLHIADAHILNILHDYKGI